jgi:maltose alpha-D-glucosyltransferase/alpha-amylase
MRLNLGIRRRLAPLLDNDRRKIELMNSMLFTLTGTPIIYYGDEIGMGDNIWLPDRNGVRTPMQWHDGPNAGFSDAPAEKLWAPVIDDPVYGYQKVNVAAQRADPNSLFHTIRRFVAVRKQHLAFGRGDLTFLEPSSKAILAYLRRYGNETVLAVHNLGNRKRQARLDLAEFSGNRPLDLLTGETLPALTEAPLRLTMPPYGYRWLKLAG